MTENAPQDLEDLVPPPAEPAAVDEGQVRRQSVLSGMWKGIKRGLLFGGVAGLGLTTLGTVLAYSVGGLALKTTGAVAANAPGWLIALGKTGKVGAMVAGGLAAAGAAFGINAASSLGGIGELALGAVSAFGALALPVVGGALAVGALIGGTWGAISGYMDSDKDVEAEKRKAHQVAAQLNFERKRVMQEILQEREMEARFDRQTEDLYAGISPDIGQLRSPNTPPQQGQQSGIDTRNRETQLS